MLSERDGTFPSISERKSKLAKLSAGVDVSFIIENKQIVVQAEKVSTPEWLAE